MFAEGDKLNALMLDKDRKELEKQHLELAASEQEEPDEGPILELEEEIYQLSLQIGNITETLESFEDSCNFHAKKLNSLNEEAIALAADNIEPLKFSGLQSVDAARVTLQTFFVVMLDLNIYKRDLENKCIESDETIIDLTAQIQMFQSRIQELQEKINSPSNIAIDTTTQSTRYQASKEKAIKNMVNVRLGINAIKFRQLRVSQNTKM